jgi:integrase
VVSERLGHASAVVTMTVYAHVLPGSQRQAAEGFAAMVEATRQ